MTPVSRPIHAAPASESGPESLCAQWYEAHGDAVYNYFRFQLAAPDEAEDLTAETFLRAVRASGRFDASKASALTWLLTIARNVFIDHLRHERVRRHVTLDELRDLPVDAPSPEERMLRREQVAAVLDAMATLRPEDREILGLRFGGELEVPEIAAALGVRAGTVRTRLWRAVERLRERLT
jgi:RNA polymerase sigma-70 factor (ECF subfamily)